MLTTMLVSGLFGRTSTGLPRPFAAAAGLAAASIDEARRLPVRVAMLPLSALSAALGVSQELLQRYDELVVRGDTLVLKVQRRTAHAEDVVGEALDDAADRVVGVAGRLATDIDEGAAEAAADGGPADAGPRVSEPFGAELGDDPDVPVVAHDELPLTDYDHLTIGSLRGRVRSLDAEDLRVIRAYEKAHANRLPVVTLFDNRLARLAQEAGVTS